MNIFKYQMLGLVNFFSDRVGFTSPEQEDNTLSLLVDGTDNLLCELLPAMLLVAIRKSFANCQDRIQEENSLASPPAKISVERLRHLEINIRVIFKRYVDVLKGRRHLLLRLRDRK